MVVEAAVCSTSSPGENTYTWIVSLMRWRLLVRDQALMTALAASAAYRRLPVVVPVLRAGEGHRGLCPRDEHERVYEPVSRRRMSTKYPVTVIESHLCRLSGLGYRCSRSGQNGHI